MRWPSHGILLLLLLLLRIIHVLRLLSRTGLLLLVVGVHINVERMGLGRAAIGIEGRWLVPRAKAVRGRIHGQGMALSVATTILIQGQYQVR
jgi:hypothetical protein